MRRSSFLLAALLVLPTACVETPEPRGGADTPAEGQTGAAAQPAAAASPDAQAPKPGSTELSAEELALIEADPKTLSAEQNRKRGYALRKKIMQNPDSEAAKTLEETRAAAIGGELPPEQVKPEAENKDEGLVIPLPEHLEDQRVSKGEPALD